MPNLATRPDRLLTEGYLPNIKCAGHLTLALNPTTFAEALHGVLETLSHYDFDAIAFRGLSGALLAPTVAMYMGKTLLAVRKTTDDCHSGRIVEGDYNARRFVILDDFVSSGETVRRILEDVSKALPNASCLGVCEYMFLKSSHQLKSVDSIFNSWRTPPKMMPRDSVEQARERVVAAKVDYSVRGWNYEVAKAFTV